MPAVSALCCSGGLKVTNEDVVSLKILDSMVAYCGRCLALNDVDGGRAEVDYCEQKHACHRTGTGWGAGHPGSCGQLKAGFPAG